MGKKKQERYISTGLFLTEAFEKENSVILKMTEFKKVIA